MRVPTAARLFLIPGFVLVMSAHAGSTDTGRVDKGSGNTQNIPIALPKNAPSIIGDFGQDGQGSHTGEIIEAIYISRPPDDLAIAAADGVVARVRRGSVFISHDNGMTTFYAPVDEVLVSTGDVVKRGQPLARTAAGNSSESYWQHKLTFGVGEFGGFTKVNPHKYWLGGPGKIVCFDPSKNQTSSGDAIFTYPVLCEISDEQIHEANLNGSWRGSRECQGIESKNFETTVKDGKFFVNLGGAIKEQFGGVITPNGEVTVSGSYVDGGKKEKIAYAGQLPRSIANRKVTLQGQDGSSACKIVLTSSAVQK